MVIMSCLIIIGLCIFGVIWLEIKRVSDIDIDVDDNDFTPDEYRIIMPEITMCTDKQCPLNVTCYRYNATPSNYQSYFSQSPRDNIISNTVKCDYYLEFKK